MTRARNSANLASHGNLFVDIANDRTGIGSVVPAQNLHVAGTAGFHADATFTGDLYNTTWDRSENTLRFNDNAQIKLGTGNDAKLRHDGSNTWIQNNTGYMYVDAQSSSGIRFISQSHWQAGAMAAFYPDGAVVLYHDANQKFSTTAYGTNITGTTDTDGLIVSGVATVTTMNVTGVLTYDDVTSVDSVGIVTARQGVRVTADGSSSSNYISVGAGSDLKLWHDSNNVSRIQSDNQILYIKGADIRFYKGNSSELFARFISDGAVELYHNNGKKFETRTDGVEVTGNVINDGIRTGDLDYIMAGNSGDIAIFHDSNGSIHGTSAVSYIKCQGVHDNILDIFTASATGKIRLKSNNLAETMLVANGNGAVELYHNNSKKFETTSSGATVSGQLTAGTSGGQNPSQTSWATNSALNLYGSYGGGIAFNDNGNNGFVQYVESAGVIFNLKAGAVGGSLEQVIRAVKDGQVELFYNNTKKIETTNTGINVTGNVVSDGLVVDGNSDLNGNLDVSGSITAGGDLSIAQELVHTGDTDTRLRFFTDTIALNTAGIERFKIHNDGTIGIGQSSKSGTVGAGGLDIQGNATNCILEMGNPFPGFSGGVVPEFRITATNSSHTVDFESVWGGDNLLHKHLAFAGGTTKFYKGTTSDEIARFDSDKFLVGATSSSGARVIFQQNSSDTNPIDQNTSADSSGLRIQNYSFGVGRYTALSLECANSSMVQSASIIAQSVSSGQAPDIKIATRTSVGGNTERLRITSGGQVNIGGDADNLSQTTYPFSVSGSTGGNNQINIVQRLKYSGSSNQYNNGVVIAFTNTETNANAYSYIGARIDSGSSGANANALVFATNATNTAPTEKLRITSGGNVGINESSPSTKLHISGGSNENITLTLEPGGTAGNYSQIVLGRTSSAPTVQTTAVVKGGTAISGVPGIIFGSTNTNLPCVALETANSSNGHIVFKPKGSERVRISSAGYIGINQTSPQRYLHITGNDGATGATLGNSDTLLVLDNLGVNGPIIEFASANSGAGRIQFTDTDAANQGRIEYLHTNDSMRIRTAGTERFVITQHGSITNTTSSSHDQGAGTFNIRGTIDQYSQGSGSGLIFDCDFGRLTGYSDDSNVNNGTNLSGVLAHSTTDWSSSSSTTPITVNGGTLQYRVGFGGYMEGISNGGRVSVGAGSGSPNMATTLNTASMTIESWVWYGNGGREVIASRWGSGFPAQFNMICDPDGQFHYNSGGVGAGGGNISGEHFPSKTWHHHVWQYDSSNNVHRWYINGAFANSRSHGSSLAVSSNTGFGIFSRADRHEDWRGKIAVVRIYNRVLSSYEIKNHFELDRGRFGI